MEPYMGISTVAQGRYFSWEGYLRAGDSIEVGVLGADGNVSEFLILDSLNFLKWAGGDTTFKAVYRTSNATEVDVSLGIDQTDYYYIVVANYGQTQTFYIRIRRY